MPTPRRIDCDIRLFIRTDAKHRGGTNWADAPENAQLALFDTLPNCKLEVRYKILSATGILGFVGISLFCRTFSKVGPVSRTTLVAGLCPDTLGGSLQCSADKLAGYDAREERGGAGLNTVKGGMGNDMLCLFIS